MALLDTAAGVFNGQANAGRPGRDALEVLTSGIVSWRSGKSEERLWAWRRRRSKANDGDLAKFDDIEIDGQGKRGEVHIHLDARGRVLRINSTGWW